MFRALVLFCFLLVSGCSSDSNKNTLVLDYKDFGPQIIASEVIGMKWWQWQDHGDSRPRDYAIKVVVYRGITLDEVKKSYVVDPAQEQDYRYLQYDTAITFLDKKIKENLIDMVSMDLKETRSHLVSKLGGD